MIESMLSSKKFFTAWNLRGILLWVVLPLIAGTLLSFFIRQPLIGVIHLTDAIYNLSAQDMIAQISYARQHPEIKAVVLVIDSPGGTVADTEAVYMELVRLRQTKPVITVVDGMAASGAYYLAVGTDYILAKPNSTVGSVGVYSALPKYPLVVDDVYSTGPYKLWGSSRDTTVREIEVAKQGFLQAVKLGRAKVLKAPNEIILSGQVWNGVESLKLGLVDEIGSLSQACEKAATIARIAHYRAEDLRVLAGLPERTSEQFFLTSSEGILTPYPAKAGIYYLYVPPIERLP